MSIKQSRIVGAAVLVFALVGPFIALAVLGFPLVASVGLILWLICMVVGLSLVARK